MKHSFKLFIILLASTKLFCNELKFLRVENCSSSNKTVLIPHCQIEQSGKSLGIAINFTKPVAAMKVGALNIYPAVVLNLCDTEINKIIQLRAE